MTARKRPTPRAETMDPRLLAGGMVLNALIDAAVEVDPDAVTATIEELKGSWSESIRNHEIVILGLPTLTGLAGVWPASEALPWVRAQVDQHGWPVVFSVVDLEDFHMVDDGRIDVSIRFPKAWTKEQRDDYERQLAAAMEVTIE